MHQLEPCAGASAHPIDDRRLVPRGIEIVEPGGIGVSIGRVSTDAQQMAIGWRGAGSTATNWAVQRQAFEIYANCTNNPDEAYAIACATESPGPDDESNDACSNPADGSLPPAEASPD